MEDYIPILIVAGVMLIKLFSPNKKKQLQPTSENFPELPDLSDLFPDKAIPAFEPLGAAPVVEGGRASDTEQKLAQMRETTASEKVPKEIPKRDEVLEDFDIRRAIIYNEILRPKYLE